jgi:hypothetical protein
VSYEYLYESVEKLKDKPFRADEVMRLLNEAGIYPIHLRVDNAFGQVIAYFERELTKKEKEELNEGMKKIFKDW